MPIKKIPLIFGVPPKSFYARISEKKAFVAELRPGLEGMQIVAGELLKNHIRPVIICDNMLAFCMKQGLVKEAHIFCEGLSKRSGLCRTGSLIAALCAKAHHVPVFLHQGRVAGRKPSSLLKMAGMKVTSTDIKTYVPFFEEVPLTLVKG